jgi:hypothetical protein
VEYLIQVRLLKEKDRVHASETPFSVVELPVTKLHPQSCSTSKSMLFPPKKLTLTANLPRQAYAVGECVPVRISLDNETNREIKSLLIYLSRTLLFQLKQTTAKLSQKGEILKLKLIMINFKFLGGNKI